ncbi:hypothetical protein BKH41_02145 [Helicobacter sp. 12S02232-10]|uniref:hypothetical protein n=1 Tax=Helicobacter sp. 12S02232-10 TaxID=1476197 RepID=UPI000BA60DCE|nr:hypothetical protein [Helicobacter sp. 12S02232-10]PAF49488.1 hypothetical protein BKH41_02145 [Helicobacter sp. 12S02232-10]
MKKAGIVVFALILGGCVSLKIKSESPKIEEYDLNGKFQTSIKCEKYKNLALIGVDSAPSYDTKNILKRFDDGKIEALEGKKWIDLPKNMFVNLLVQEASKHCVLVSLPPFGVYNPQKILKVNILAFDVSGSEAPKARIALSYEFFVSGKKIEGILADQEAIKGNDIKALQEVSKRVADNLVELFGF